MTYFGFWTSVKCASEKEIGQPQRHNPEPFLALWMLSGVMQLSSDPLGTRARSLLAAE